VSRREAERREHADILADGPREVAMTNETQARVASKATTTVSPKVIVGLVVAALALSFVFQNTGEGDDRDFTEKPPASTPARLSMVGQLLER
jgi:hypothetical protein